MAFDPDAYLSEGKTTSGFDPDAYLGIEKKKLSLLEQFGPQAIGAIKSVANDPLTQMGLQVAGGDISGAMFVAKGIAQDPSAAVRSPSVQTGLPIAGGAIAGPVGAAGGEVLRQSLGNSFAPETVPKTMLGRGGSVLAAGALQDPMAIPGVPQVSEMMGNLASKAGKGVARAMQAFSGGKAGDYIETAKKGISMYSAPSKQEAGNMMAQALEKLPGASVVPTLKETIQTAINPEASEANKFLVDLAEKMDKGHLPDAREALRAKQALDDVIDTVNPMQKKRLGNLFNIKKTFDDVLSNQSGELKTASDAYRAAVLKDNMTKFLPVNKSGEYSRLAPMLSSIAGTAKGLVTSPLLFGGLAAGGGSAARGLMKMGENPAIRQALLQVLQRMEGNSNAGRASQ